MRRLNTPAMALIAFATAIILLFAGCSGDSGDGGSPTPSPTSGNGTISGKVTDEAGTALSGAKVTVNAIESKDGETRSAVQTDANGEFIFEDLATGIKYKVVAIYNGRVTVEVIVDLADETPATFEVRLPQGSGTASFNLPSAPVLGEPTGTPYIDEYYYSSKDSKVIYPGQFSGANYMQVNLSWTKGTDKGLTFEKYLIFRSDKSGVGTNSTPVFEDTSDFTVTAADQLPCNEFGRYHYKLYKSFTVPEYNARLLVGSNEVSFWWDKYIYSSKIENEENLVTPLGMAIYETDAGVQAIYVTDVPGYMGDSKISLSGKVHKFDKDGNLVATWETYNDGEGEKTFEMPKGIDTDEDGNVYIVDSSYDEGRVIVLNSNGEYLRSWASYNATGIAVGPGYAPIITPESTGKESMETVVYVTNNDDSSFHKYNTEGTAYDVITGATTDLMDIAVDKDGNVYPAGEYYTFFKFSPKGTKVNTFYYEIDSYFGIDVDKDGNIFVTNNQGGYSRAKKAAAVANNLPGFVKFNSEGIPLSFIANPGDEDGQFGFPLIVRVDSEGKVYITDPEMKRITIYKPDYENEE